MHSFTVMLQLNYYCMIAYWIGHNNSEQIKEKLTHFQEERPSVS